MLDKGLLYQSMLAYEILWWINIDQNLGLYDYNEPSVMLCAFVNPIYVQYLAKKYRAQQ